MANLMPTSILRYLNSFELATASISLQTPAASEILLSTVVVSVPLSFIHSPRYLYSLTFFICLPFIFSSSMLLFSSSMLHVVSQSQSQATSKRVRLYRLPFFVVTVVTSEVTCVMVQRF